MTERRPDATDPSFALGRRLAFTRHGARLVLFAESLAPRLLAPLSVVLLFLSTAWLGLFRIMPLWLHGVALVAFALALAITLLPLLRLRWPATDDADRMLEARNGLRHQAIRVQHDRPATDSPFAAALWAEHQARMARLVERLDTGLPQPDIARRDRYGLRALPVLVAVVAFAYSYSNRAGMVSDAVHLPEEAVAAPDIRIDAWVTPPAYTGRAPVFLTGRTEGEPPAATEASSLTVPQFSDLTVRITGGVDQPVTFARKDAAGAPIVVPAEEAKLPEATATGEAAVPVPPPAGVSTHLYKVTADGTLTVGARTWTFAVIPDEAPEISFDGDPRITVNAALDIGFIGKDDYGLQEAHAEILPLEETPGARPLYPLPDYTLDLPRRNAREAKGVTSRNLTEHPLAGKPVRITLVATDAAGQEGRSQPVEMILPARTFFEPLAGAVAEQRQTFALDANALPRALELNEALTIRPEDTIPNTTHFLLLQSARARMELAHNDDMLRDAAQYLWEIALGIEDGNLSLAERRLREAQQELSDALDRNAGDEEISRLMQELREAMQEYMQALAEQAMKNPQVAANPEQNNVLRQQDLQKMMDQIENLAKSGAKDQAKQMLSELQRMMNNLQAGRMPPNQQQGQDNSEMRRQMDKLGELMQRQQQLMEQTFRFDQALRDRMQTGDPLTGEDQEMFGQEQDPGQQGGEQQGGQQESQNPLDSMTAEQLREALKQLRAQQEALGKQLGELQQGMEGMGMQPGKGFGKAQQEMQGAAGELGNAQGEQALGSQGRALQALREGAQEMMNQMQSQGPGQGPGQGVPQFGQNGRDPLGRRQQNMGPDFGEQVKVPDEIDTQRARQILEEIRRRLGTNASPETERQYLERLLDIR
ncbi:TIGR02302 family protein [Ensifer soli]|uniref:TIGR02302 family protein n=1 Tax=Ciceribacter sp. sgz301302 TaxID=3342379 RepID=UPI0035BB55A2